MRRDNPATTPLGRGHGSGAWGSSDELAHGILEPGYIQIAGLVVGEPVGETHDGGECIGHGHLSALDSSVLVYSGRDRIGKRFRVTVARRQDATRSRAGARQCGFLAVTRNATRSD
jgi:hypothetical protein